MAIWPSGLEARWAGRESSRAGVLPMDVQGMIFDCVDATRDAAALLSELDAHGVAHVSVGGPAEYDAALDELGTPRGSTWVVAGTASSLRAARQRGLPRVCLLEGRGGRSQRELEGESDIAVHSLAELSVALIRDYERPRASAETAGAFRALVVDGSPAPSSLGLVRALASSADYVIAADRGVDVLFGLGVAPDAFCGDADTADPRAAAWARGRAKVDIRYPRAKYETDLGLAITCAHHEAARRSRRLELTLTCASGGRPDHALAVMGVAAAQADAWPRIVEDAFECRLLSPGGRRSWPMRAAVGRRFSAIALREGAVLSETGSRWELDREPLALLSDEGVSNEVVADPCVVTCHAGVVAVFLMR